MIDLKKKYRTRDGRPATILCVDAPGKYPVLGYIPYENDPSVSKSIWWSIDGNAHPTTDSNHDLIEAPSTLEAGKTYNTRDGRTAVVLATDAPGKYSAVGYIIITDGGESHNDPTSWAINGSYIIDDSNDEDIIL